MDESSLENRISNWLITCFGETIANDHIERNHRFLEEALELVQANGCTINEAHELVDYVFGRPKGDIKQEVGGAVLTLAALCFSSRVNMLESAEEELDRVWKNMDSIRKKQASKPKHSSLPGEKHV